MHQNGRFFALFVAFLLIEDSLPFVAMASTRFEIESHRAFSLCIVLIEEDGQKSEQCCVVMTIRLWCLYVAHKTCW